jgi:hypothetical protein
MQVISAKVLDATHLELSQPLQASPGEVIEISLALSADDEMNIWREVGKQRLLDAYADEDAVYDNL